MQGSLIPNQQKMNYETFTKACAQLRDPIQEKIEFLRVKDLKKFQICIFDYILRGCHSKDETVSGCSK